MHPISSVSQPTEPQPLENRKMLKRSMEISEQDIRKAENSITRLQNEIKSLEETVIWQWFIAEGKRKESILERLMILMYEQSTKNITSS